MRLWGWPVLTNLSFKNQVDGERIDSWNRKSQTKYNYICSMYGILPTFGCFLGHILLNIPAPWSIRTTITNSYWLGCPRFQSKFCAPFRSWIDISPHGIALWLGNTSPHCGPSPRCPRSWFNLCETSCGSSSFQMRYPMISIWFPHDFHIPGA